MRKTFTHVFATALVSVVSVSLACHAQEAASEPNGSVLAEARQWVLAEGRELHDWTPDQLLGAAELLHLTTGNSPEERQVKLVRGVVARLSESARTPGGAALQEGLLRARLIWLLVRDDRASDEYFDVAKLLTEHDSDNAVAWVLLGESSWLRGDFKAFVMACYRVHTAKVATLHSQHYRQRICAVLDKARKGTSEAKRELLIKPLPYSTYAMYVRHISLLDSMPKIAGIIGAKGNHSHLAVRYLVFSTLSMPVGQAFDLNALNVLLQRGSDNGDGAVGSLLKQQQKVLAMEAAEVEYVAKHGKLGEIDQVIQRPAIIRDQVLKAQQNAAPSLRKAEWLKVLSGQQEGEHGGPGADPGSPVGPGIGDVGAGGTNAGANEAQKPSGCLCPECGSSLPSNVSRCPKCGHQLLR
jgi:hypothetical protein